MTVGAPATMPHRVGAVVIDSVIGAAVVAAVAGGVLAASVLSAGVVGILVLLPAVAGASLVWFLVHTALQGGRGSIGMRVMGLRLERADEGDGRLGFGRALGRNLVWTLTCSVVVGLFSPLFDSSRWRRGWHDLAVGAVIVHPADVLAVTPAAPVEPAPVEPAPVARIEPAPVLIPQTAAAAAAPDPRPVVSAAATGHGDPLPAPSWAPASVPANRPIPRTLPVDVISTVPGVPHRDGQPASAERVSPPVIAILRWDDGTRHTIYEPTLFGRGPGQQAGRRSTPVRDETLSLSKTHFEVGADERGSWVVDRHSLNGVVIVRAGQPQRLVPGEPARIWSGDVLELGDRRLTVESAR